MKRQSYISRSFSIFLILIFLGACSKDVATPAPPPPPPPPPPHVERTYTVDADNWINVSKGKYQSDLYQIVKKYAGDFNNISEITINSYYGALVLTPGNSVPYADGLLISNGNILEFSAQTHYGQSGTIPFTSISLKVTVN